MFQRCPKGSVSWPWRSPQKVSPSSCRAAAPALTARAHRAFASSVLICKTVAVLPIVSGETIPISGNSLPTCMTDSPMASSTVITLSPGSGMRLSSRALNAFAYHAAAASASGTTRCASTFTLATIRPSPHAGLVRLSGEICVAGGRNHERLAKVAVEVALVDESSLDRHLGDRDTALEHPACGADSKRELEPMRRHVIRRTEQPAQPVPADPEGTCKLVERDVGGELVA